MKKWHGDLIFVLVIVILVGGWFSLYPRSSTSPMMTLDAPLDLDVEPRTYAAPDGTELAYRLYAPTGEVKSVLVFLHDTLLHSAWYAELGYGLAGHGVAVLAPDRRGWGHSAGERRQNQDADVLVEDLMALVNIARARYPQARLYIGAHGRGAGIALRYLAARRPADGLVLIAPVISSNQPNLNPDGWARWVQAHPVEAWLARSGLKNWAVWSYRWPQTMIKADPLLETTCSLVCEQETYPTDPQAACRAVTVPLLYVQGEQDFLFALDKLPDLMAQFATSDQQAILISGADYLSVLTSAAGPIADWMEKNKP